VAARNGDQAPASEDGRHFTRDGIKPNRQRVRQQAGIPFGQKSSMRKGFDNPVNNKLMLITENRKDVPALNIGRQYLSDDQPVPGF